MPTFTNDFYFKTKEELIAIANLLPYPMAMAEIKENFDTDGLYFNQNVTDELGYELSEIKHIDKWFETVYPDEDYRNSIKQEFRDLLAIAKQNNDRFVKLKVKLTLKNKSQKWYEIKTFFINTFYCFAFIDINNEVILLEELKKQNENNNRMLSVLGHDLRMPIANLTTISEMAANNDISTAEFVEMIGLINKESKQVLEMLETTFNWAKINFNQITTKPAPINYQKLAENILALYQTSCDEKNIAVSINLHDFKTKDKDEEIITVIVRNLISNAIKFTPVNGNINIYSENHNLFIQDNGKGMTTKKIEAIKNNNYLSTRGTNNELGIGMGLQLVQKLAEKTGAFLQFESQINQGTTVSLCL